MYNMKYLDQFKESLIPRPPDIMLCFQYVKYRDMVPEHLWLRLVDIQAQQPTRSEYGQAQQRKTSDF